VAPKEVLFIFWHPAFDKNVVGILQFCQLSCFKLSTMCDLTTSNS
jgi:hypothetical protein